MIVIGQLCVYCYCICFIAGMHFTPPTMFSTPGFWISNSLVFRGPHLPFSYAKQVGNFLLFLSFKFRKNVCFESQLCKCVLSMLKVNVKYFHIFFVPNHLDNNCCYFSPACYLVLHSWSAFAFFRHLFSSPQFSSTLPSSIVLSSCKLVLSLHLFIGPSSAVPCPVLLSQLGRQLHQ